MKFNSDLVKEIERKLARIGEENILSEIKSDRMKIINRHF